MGLGHISWEDAYFCQQGTGRQSLGSAVILPHRGSLGGYLQGEGRRRRPILAARAAHLAAAQVMGSAARVLPAASAA